MAIIGVVGVVRIVLLSFTDISHHVRINEILVLVIKESRLISIIHSLVIICRLVIVRIPGWRIFLYSRAACRADCRVD